MPQLFAADSHTAHRSNSTTGTIASHHHPQIVTHVPTSPQAFASLVHDTQIVSSAGVEELHVPSHKTVHVTTAPQLFASLVQLVS